jgi:Transposase domain (DUF772)
MRTLADRLAVRWYVGDDLAEALPDRSSLSKIRQRYGLAVFRRFFEAIVEQCQAVGLVWGRELYIDATKVVADAAVDSVTPRFAVAARAHVDDLFARDAEALGPSPSLAADGEAADPPLSSGRTAAEAEDLATLNAARHDWVAGAGRQDRTRVYPRYQRTSDVAMSTTDPDATHLCQRDGVGLGYQAHYVVDGGKARIILAALVAPAEVPEDRPALDLFWHVCFRWHIRACSPAASILQHTASFTAARAPWWPRGAACCACVLAAELVDLVGAADAFPSQPLLRRSSSGS